MTSDTDEEIVKEAEERARKEAGQIGGPGAEQEFPPEERAVREAGGGEAEGFEESEAELIKTSTHQDQIPPTVIFERSPGPEEDPGSRADGEADHIRTSQEG